MFLKFLNSSSFKKPFIANVAYNAGAQWPLDNTNLSLFSSFGFNVFMFISLKYNTASISAIDNEPPGCPDCA